MPLRRLGHMLLAIMLVWSATLTITGNARAACAPVQRLDLVAMLKAQDFAGLSEILTNVQADYEAGRCSEINIENAAYAFSNTDPALAAPLERWIQEAPDNFAPFLARGSYRWKIGVNHSTRASSRQSYRLALEDLSKAIELRPRLSIAYAIIINLSLRTGWDDWKEWAYERAQETVPASYTVRAIYVHRLYPDRGGSVEALRKFLKDTEPYIDQEPALARFRGIFDVAESHVHRKNRDYEAEAASLRKAHQFANGNGYFFALGINAYRAKEFDASDSYFEQLVAVGIDRPQYYNWRGWAKYELGDRAAALSDFDMAVNLDRLNPKFLKDRARLLIEKRHYTAAKRDYDAALVLGESDHEYWHLRAGINFYYTLNLREAIGDSWRALRLRPDRSLYWKNLAAAVFYGLVQTLRLMPQKRI